MIEKCSACNADRPIASYTVINELEKQQKEAMKLEKELEQAKQASMDKTKSLTKPNDAVQRTETGGSGWGDDDFQDDADGDFDDGGWDDDDDGNNDPDWSMGSNNKGHNDDEKDEKKDNFSDDGWGGDLVDTQYTSINHNVPIKAREFEVLNPYKLHEYMQKILSELSGVLFMDDLGKVASLWYVFVVAVVFVIRAVRCLCSPCNLLLLACIVFLMINHFILFYLFFQLFSRYFRWNREKMLDQWMVNQDKISKEVGLESQKPAKAEKQTDKYFFCFTCCDDKVEWKNVYHLGCNHVYCSSCWKNYLTAQMEKGPRVVSQARCMEPKCRLAVPPATFEKFLDFKHRNKYQEYLLHSFVEGRKELEWCPGRDCINAAKAEFGSMITVECSCKHLWCFSCKMDAHLPCTCELAEKWSKLCNSDQENLTWVNAYAKKCVKCKNFIEKNQGCSHMTCRCGYEFCWLCLKEWKSVGGYGHACNKPKEVVAQEDHQKQLQGYLERFTHYGERYTFNEQAVNITTNKSLKNADNIVKTLLQTKKSIKYNDVEFILEAIQEIIRSRRILQWTYCYGYYCKDKTNQKHLFETQQSQLERFADELHDKAEKVVDDPEQHQKVKK